MQSNVFFSDNRSKLVELKSNTSSISWKHHVAFWVIYYIFNTLKWGSYYNDIDYSIKSNLIEFPIHILNAYFHAYYLIPKFIIKKRYILYALQLISMLTAMYYAKVVLTYIFVNKIVWPEASAGVRANFLLHYTTVVLGELYVIGITTAIKLTLDKINSIKRYKELESINLHTEIKYLRAQIQPHFFFNTLNNLYALIIEKSDNAPKVILKLSELMQYVLYETQDDYTPLIKEIKYIENYIDLEKLRFDARLKYKIEITGNIDDVIVPPLIFLPFIENCFKHGIDTKENNIIIDIKFDASSEFLNFEVSNSISGISISRFKQTNKGIGIINVKKRLELNYPKNYQLDIKEIDNKYTVVLRIPKQNVL